MRPTARHSGCAIRPSGFTLVEVLCCCAVVALLTGLLLPALAGAREAGRAAACSSNLRQLALASDLYAGDNRSSYAPGAPDYLANRTRWFGARASLSLPFDSEGGPLSGYLGGVGGQSVRRCGSFAPSTASSAAAFERGCGGYGYNNAFVGVRGRWAGPAWLVETDRSGAPVAAFANPSAVIAFADAAFFAGNGTPGLIEYSFTEPRRWPGDPSQRPEPSIHFRHHSGRSKSAPGLAAAAWLDGHVDSVPRAFTWSSGLYGTPAQDALLGWPGERDDNTLFGGR
ncbi:MAG: prepilin-type N-terminal cleavage/methylation domain-containing protein [Phycisphaerales bacterium]|nr:prepilin-type N-terminal cleavage/methylation domain-containing protein [Phycisphaerales bacterium]